MDDLPASMRDELQQWNNGNGIDLESWIACEGSFKFAVGYATIFWPRFERIRQYILREGTPDKSIESFETQPDSSPLSVEAVLNHLHLKDIQHAFCEDATSDKLAYLGKVLKEIYEAKLAWQFPDDPCEVNFFIPEDREDLWEYQITFWQRKWRLADQPSSTAET